MKETKTCEHCSRKFETSNPRKKYCQPSCKQRAYESRKGLEVPSFLLGNDYDVLQKEEIVKLDNPLHKQLLNQLEQVNKGINQAIEDKKSIEEKLKGIHLDKGLLFGAVGGGTVGSILTINSENNSTKVLSALGGVMLGMFIGSENASKKQIRHQQIQILSNQINKLEESIQQYKRQQMTLNVKILRTPKTIEQKEMKEVKIPKRKGLLRKDKKSAPFVTASELSEMEFELYKLEGRFKKFFGDISKNSFITCFGQPGSGKSTYFVQLADYFTKFGMVVYVTPEEGVSPTFKQKLTRLNISNDNLHIRANTSLKEIRKALKDYDYKFCFIDSINMLSDVTPQDFEKLRLDYPQVLFAIIMQSTKDGKFKGSNEYAHNSDINIKVEKGIASTIKNRFNELKEFDIFSD